MRGTDVPHECPWTRFLRGTGMQHMLLHVRHASATQKSGCPKSVTSKFTLQNGISTEFKMAQGFFFGSRRNNTVRILNQHHLSAMQPHPVVLSSSPPTVSSPSSSSSTSHQHLPGPKCPNYDRKPSLKGVSLIQ